MTEEIYHILISKRCTHKCPLCCNRLYDLDKLPTITGEQLREAHTVCLTGGEPFLLEPWNLIHLCGYIREQYPNIQKMYIYSSGSGFMNYSYDAWLRLIKHIDGLNVSPKNEYEWDVLRKLHLQWHWSEYMGDERLSNRLYVFDDQWSQYELFKQNFTLTDNWQVIGRKWDAEFKTPENEHFVRLPILW